MLFSDQTITRRPRALPVGFSLAVHAGLLALLMIRSNVPPRQNAYQQLIAGKEPKLLWYKFRDKLPDVRPVNRNGENQKPKAEVKLANQNIISSPKDAPKARQMVWQPIPELKLEKDVPAPNVLAALPEITPPERRRFTPPAPRVRDEAKVNVPLAPELQARATSTQHFDLPKVYRPFVPPTAVRSVPQRVLEALPEAPAIAAHASAEVPGLSADLLHVRKPFTPPAARASSSAGDGAAPEVPAAPQIAVAHNTYSGAIVGLDPAETLNIPKGSRAAQFSAGPVLNPNGGTPGSAKDALSVPDLYVKGGGKDLDNRPTVVARSVLPRMPTSVMSDDTLRGTSRYMTVKDIGHSSGTRVANAPDPRFNGRQVYTILVQMPNITSYVGSWMMWYSAREDSRPLDDPIQAPTPLHKVDPKYIATAVEERVQGAVRLACLLDSSGHVTHVELVRGVDERLDRSAVEAFRKWQFEPATRKGEPVAVDLLVEIPFRLAPRIPN